MNGLSQVEQWKENIIGGKVVSVEMSDTGIKSIILEKKGSHIKIFPDSKTGINAIFVRFENGKEIFV